MADDITDAEFPGPGPYAIPVLAQIESLDNFGDPEFALLRCAFEDGAPVYVTILNLAAEKLVEFLSLHLGKVAEEEAADETKH